ncbi:uncharacterized protein [Vicugna pacos]|uniref:Uncharacterized protein n=1 Tax=Vicugna pacos TaxID=30538 RepID=A0ABM5BDK8_VICPA
MPLEEEFPETKPAVSLRASGSRSKDGLQILEIYELLAASWGASRFLLFVWRTVCAVKPPKPQVPLRQMAEKIKNVEEKSRELAENVSAWKQKENFKTVEKDNEYLNNIIQITLAKLQAARGQDAKSPHSGLATEPEAGRPAADSQTFGLAPGPVTAHDTLSCVDGAGPTDTFGPVTVPQSGEPDEADFFPDEEGLATEPEAGRPAADSQTFGLAPGPVTAHDTLSCVDGAGPTDTFGPVTVPQSGEPDEADFFPDEEGLATEPEAGRPAADSQTFGLAPGPVTAHDTLSCVDGAGPTDTFGPVTVPQSGEPDEADFFPDEEGLATEPEAGRPAADSQTFGLAPGPVTAHDTLSCVDGAGPTDTFGPVTVPQSGEPDEADFFPDEEGLATEPEAGRPAADSQTFGLAPGPVTAHDTLSCVDGAGPTDTFGPVTVPQSGEPDEADFFPDEEGLATEPEAGRPAADSQTFGLAPGPVTAHDTLSCVDGAGPTDTFGPVTVPQSGEPDEADFFPDEEGLATEPEAGRPAADSQTFGLAPGPVTAHDTLSCVDGAGPTDTFGPVTVPQSGEPDEADFFPDEEGLATEPEAGRPAADSQTFGLAPGPVTAHDTLSCVDGAGPTDTFGPVTVPQSGEPDEADFFPDEEGLATEPEAGRPAADSQTFGLAPGPVTAHDTLSCVDGAGPTDTFGPVTVPQSGEPDEADFFPDEEGLATEPEAGRPAADSQTFGLAPGPVTAHDTLSCVDGAGPTDTFGPVTVPQSGEPDEADFFPDEEGLATEPEAGRPAADSQTFGLAPGPVTAHDTLSCVDGAGPTDTFGPVTVPQSGEPDEADFFPDEEGLATEPEAGRPAADSQTFGLAPGPVTAHDTLSCVDGAGPTDTFGPVTVPQSGEPDEADFFPDEEGLATEPEAGRPAADSQTFGLAPGPVTAHDTLSCVDGAGPTDTFGPVTVPQSGEPDEADFFPDEEGLATEPEAGRPAADSQTFGLAPGPVTAHDTLSCVDGAGPTDTFGPVTVPQSGEPDEADFFPDEEGLATEPEAGRPAADSQTFGLAPGPVTAHDTLSCVDGAGPTDTFGPVTVPQSGEPDEADFFPDEEGLATEPEAGRPAADSQTFGLAPGPVTAHDTLSCVDGAGPTDTFGPVTVPQSGEPDEADFFPDEEGLATEPEAGRPAADSQTFGLAPGPVTAHDTLSCVDGAGPTDTFGK